MLKISEKSNLLELSQYKYSLQDVREPNLYRDVYPYSQIPKIPFNHRLVPESMPENIWITDTTFRDGQQSRAPYTPDQIVHLFKLLSKLGGPNGVIRQSEFFVYSKKDREALERCMELGLPFPEITTWIRASKSDFELVRDIGIKETGILVSCSDYHKLKKLGMSRKEAMEHLSECRVAVFGIGGVGGYVCEALARSGVGTFDLIDNDKVCLSNINRQIIASNKTVGRYKTDVMKERILDINPNAKVNTYQCFFLPENASEFPFDKYNYVVDAIDTVTAKIELVMQCQEKGVPIISAMGAGNKLDPTQFRVADIYKTKMDPLAGVMRYELKKRGVKKLKVVYSEEEPIKPTEETVVNGKATPGSTAFVPSVAGLIIAGEVIKDLIKDGE